MKMDKVANSKNDEFYTPEYAVKPILKYIPAQSHIWCPFDTKESHFVKMLTEAGHEVTHTHIETGEDFFETDILCDYIISNPPYSIKSEVLQDLFLRRTPFAMLVGVVGLFESQKRFDMFRCTEFEIMYLNRRVSYFKSYSDQKPSINPPFSSVFVCHKMLPKQIVFEQINKNPKDTPVNGLPRPLNQSERVASQNRIVDFDAGDSTRRLVKSAKQGEAKVGTLNGGN